MWKTLASTTEEDYDAVCNKLNSHFKPKKNVTYERFKFKSSKQNKDESCIDYITRLRTAAETCDFHNKSEEIRDQFVTSCYSKSLKQKLLKEDNLTLEKCKEFGQVAERSKQQANEMSDTNYDEAVNRLNKGRNSKNYDRAQDPRLQNRKSNKNCFKCGGEFNKDHQKVCPAIGRVCYHCGKQNHLSKVCRSRKNPPKVQNLQEDSENSSDSENCFSLNNVQKVHINSTSRPSTHTNKTEVKLHGVSIQMIIDTGSSIDVIDKSTFNRINKHKKIYLKRSTTKVFSYGSEKPLRMLGMFQTTIENQDRIVPCDVHVIDKQSAGNLIGLQTAKSLFDIRTTNQIADIPDKTSFNSNMKIKFENVPEKYKYLTDEFIDLTSGRGKFLNYKAHLNTDNSVRPVQQPLRRQPYQLREKINQKLQQMEHDGLIERVETPQGWINNITVTTKANGDIRICLDAREINKAIINEKFPIPTLDSLVDEMSDAKIFSKIDL